MKKNPPVLGVAVSACLSATLSLHAATDIWDGGQAGNIAWGQPANWVSDVHPAFDATQEVVFYQSGAAQTDRSNLGADRIVNKITINENVDTDMMIAMEANGGAGRQLRFAGTDCGIFIDAGAEGSIRIGEEAGSNQGNSRILDGATFSQAGKGLDIVHNGTGELILSGTEVFFEADAGGGGAGGSASLAKTGTGTLTIEQNNKITGTFYLTEGRVNFNTGNSGGDPGVNWLIADGMTIGNTSGGGVLIGANPDITLLGDLNYLSEADRNLEVGNSASTTITLQADSIIDVGSGAGANLRLEGTLVESGGSYSLTKTGAGVLRLRAPLNHTGGLVVSEGELHLGENGGMIATMATGDITLNSPGLILDRGGVTDRTWDNLITGDGRLIKIDGHTLTLTNDNTYTGNTTIDGGVLQVNGNHTGAAIPSLYEVLSGALAGDGGATESDVTVSPGASIDPGKGGFSIGLDNLSIHEASGATFAIEIDGVGDHDALTFTGSLNLSDVINGDAVLDTTGSDIVAPTASPITILDGTTEAVTGTFSGLPEGSTFVAGAQLFQITYLGGDGFDVVLTPLNDPVIEIAADATEVTEGGVAGFTLNSIPPPSGGNVTVNLSYSGIAQDGSDFTGVASIDVLDGQPSADLDLSVTDDGLLEGAESFTVTIDSVSGLGAVIGVNDSASATILDGNSAPVDGLAINQTVIDAGTPVALDDILLSDEAGGTSTIASGATEAAFSYRGEFDSAIFGDGFTGLGDDSGNDSATGDGTQSGFAISPDPNDAAGFSLDLVFTPRTADVVGGGNYRHVWDIGGTSNGSGIYLIDGALYFISKMNTNGAASPGGLNNPDWIGNAVCVPLSSGALLADQRVSLALRFSLDAIEYSLNGDASTTVALANRGGIENWNGNPDISFGEIDDVVGQRGGLSTTAGPFLTDDYVSLADGTAAITSCRFWNATDGTISATAGAPETLTATVTIRNWTDDGIEGSLSADSGNGETYSNGVWTGPVGIASLNTALADLEFIPGTEPFAVLDVSIDDQTSAGSTTGTILIATTVPTVVYVDDDFSEGRGDDVTDADQVTAGDQNAIYGYTAFRTISEASTIVDPAGTIIVNDGDYGDDDGTLTGTMTLQLTDSTGGVTVGGLNADDGTTLDLQGNDLIFSGLVDHTIDSDISGTGGITKNGTARTVLRGAGTSTGTITINDGTLRIGGQLGDLSIIGSVDAPVVVNAPGTFDLHPWDPASVITHSTLISGDGNVSAATNDGTVVFDGPPNTFTGNFILGSGASSTVNDTLAVGNQRGIVVISDVAQLGTGLIESRGAQLRTSVPGLNIPNDVEIYAGGFRLGGDNPFELSGTIVPVGGLRGLGNYSGEGINFTVSGTIDMDGSGEPFNVVFDAMEGEDNGDFLVTADVVGTGNLSVAGSFDAGTITLAGANTYTGTSFFDGSSTTLINGTHTGGGNYTVDTSTTLGGTGSTDSDVTVTDGGFLSPGASVGALGVSGGITFEDNSNFVIEIDSSVPEADLLDSDFEIEIGTGVNLVASDLAGAPVVLPLGTKLKIIDYYDDFLIGNSSLTGEFAGLTNGSTVTIGVNQFTIEYQDDLRDASGAPGTDGTADSVTLTAAGAASAYITWASGFPGLTGGFGDDDDGDGANNGFEWYFYNSDPTVAEGLGSPLSALTQTGPGTFTFTHLRPVNATGSAVNYEWSADLSTWTDSGVAEGGVTVTLTPGTTTPDADPDYETVEVTVTVAPDTAPRVFVRVEVTES